MNETQVTIAGNLGEDPELRITSSGKATARMRVAVTDRRQNNTGEWIDGNTSWHTVLAWGKLAEHAVETLTKGQRVLVHGRLAQREWAGENGEKRSTWEITAEEIGPSLRHGSLPTQGGASATWTDEDLQTVEVQEPRRTNPNNNRWAHAAKH